MLTVAQLQTFKVGDQFKATGLFAGVSDEPVHLKLEEVSHGSDYIFSMTYFGVDIGDIAVLVRKGQVCVERL